MPMFFAGATQAETEISRGRFSMQLTFEPAIRTFSMKCWVLASATLGRRSKRNWSGRTLIFQNVVQAEIDKSEQAEFY